MKFSIIIPVYNVEKYLEKCLKSVLNQSYSNFEVIVVNDGTKDNSQKIIDKYIKKDKRFKSFIKENGGLSDARNYGLNEISGDYLLFLDSDDYIEKDLLLELNKTISLEKYNLIKFKINLVDSNYNLLSKENGYDESKLVSIKEILSQEYCEPAWTYCYNVKFWKKNNYKYSVGKIHEDFGLTPYIIWSAKSIYYLNYYGYNYVQRQGSIVNGAEKNIKRTNDMIDHYDFLNNKLNKNKSLSENDKKYILSFLSNALIYKGKLLKNDDLKNYIKKLKDRNVFNLILDDSLKRKLKKIVIKKFPYFYIKYLIRG